MDNQKELADEWMALKYFCGWSTPVGVYSEFPANWPELRQKVREFRSFVDPRADVLYEQGIVRGGIIGAMAAMTDPEDLLTASLLFSRLYSLALYLTPGAMAAAPRQNVPAPVPVPEDPDAEIKAYLQRMGYDPRTAGTPLETLVAKLRDRFAQVGDGQ